MKLNWRQNEYRTKIYKFLITNNVYVSEKPLSLIIRCLN